MYDDVNVKQSLFIYCIVNHDRVCYYRFHKFPVMFGCSAVDRLSTGFAFSHSVACFTCF